MKKIVMVMVGVLFVMAVALLAGCGGGGEGGIGAAPVAPVNSTALNATDLTTRTTVYAVSQNGYIAYKFNSDGSALASTTVTSGTPVLNITGAWSIATDNKTVGLVLSGQTTNPLYTLIDKDSSGQFWNLTDSSGNAVRFYFDLTAAQAYFASLAGQVAVTSFTAADFSGKTIYYVNGGAYQEAVFNADGTVQASDLYTTGTPTSMSPIGTWNISSTGALQIVNLSGQTIVYTLLSNDAANDYYLTTKTSIGSSGSMTVGLFYNQTTGLAQAQAFTASGLQP